jgi:hypothetical protein
MENETTEPTAPPIQPDTPEAVAAFKEALGSKSQAETERLLNLKPGDLIHEPDDNWKHRSKHMRCNTCMWYVDKVSGHITEQDSLKVANGCGKVGRCRRRAPTLDGFPVMYDSDWCGDHKLDEEKVDQRMMDVLPPDLYTPKKET